MRCSTIVFVVLVASLAPMSRAEDSMPQPGAESPQAGYERLVEAIKKQNRELFYSLAANEDDAKKNARIFFEFGAAVISFKEKLIQKHGEEGWKNFQDPSGARLHLNLLEDSEEPKVEIEGDTALVTLKNGNPVAMNRIDGRWYLDFKMTLSGAKNETLDFQKTARLVSELTKLINDYKGKIDKMSVDQLDEEMGADVLRILLGDG